MKGRMWVRLIASLLWPALLLIACSPSAGAPADDPAAQQAAIETAVAATVAAGAGPGAAAPGVAAPTSTQAPPTATSTAPTDTPLPGKPTCVVQAAGLNLRTGPGTAFAPPLGALGRGTQLTPLAFTPRGFPSGQWIQVQVLPGGQIGWISAAQQSVSCNVDLTALPPGTVPPTPAAPSTQATAVSPVAQAVESDVLVGGSLGDMEGKVIVPGFAPPSLGPLIFHDRIVFQVRVHDPQSGPQDGDGIQEVQFKIYEGDQPQYEQLVYERTERTASYCVFGGGEPDCNVLVFADTPNWPGGKTIHDTQYLVNILAVPKDQTRQAAFWDFSFQVAR